MAIGARQLINGRSADVLVGFCDGFCYGVFIQLPYDKWTLVIGKIASIEPGKYSVT